MNLEKYRKHIVLLLESFENVTINMANNFALPVMGMVPIFSSRRNI